MENGRDSQSVNLLVVGLVLCLTIPAVVARESEGAFLGERPGTVATAEQKKSYLQVAGHVARSIPLGGDSEK